MSGLIRVGHKGADHVAPGNTAESFDAALSHGVDMIEFDVLRTRDGRLVLAHDYDDAEGRECLTLEEGLDHFAGEAYNGVQLDVDLKLTGYETEVLDGLYPQGGTLPRGAGPTVGQIQQLTAEAFGVTHEDLVGPGRARWRRKFGVAGRFRASGATGPRRRSPRWPTPS